MIKHTAATRRKGAVRMRTFQLRNRLVIDPAAHWQRWTHFSQRHCLLHLLPLIIHSIVLPAKSLNYH